MPHGRGKHLGRSRGYSTGVEVSGAVAAVSAEEMKTMQGVAQVNILAALRAKHGTEPDKPEPSEPTPAVAKITARGAGL